VLKGEAGMQLNHVQSQGFEDPLDVAQGRKLGQGLVVGLLLLPSACIWKCTTWVARA